MKKYISTISSTTPSLFSLKEQYLQSHDSKGRLYCLSRLSKSQQKKFTYNNKHLSTNMEYTQENGIPKIQPYNGSISFISYPFTEHKKHNGYKEALHFFIDDYKFYNAITYNLEKTTYNIIKYEYVFSPDCTLYVDATKQENMNAIYISRFAAAYWQRWGFNVIPVASWGDANSLSYCFEGLPQNSIIAVCGIGHNFCHEAQTLWHYAIKKLIESLSPTTLIVYGGNEKDIQDIPVKTKYISDFIHNNIRRK